MAETMKRWEMSAIGREHLALAEVAIPKARAGEVLVRVHAVSLNYRDKLVIETGMGLPLAFPFTPGSDLAGEVVGIGEGADRFAVGDRVISTFTPGWLDGRPAGDARHPPYKTLGGAWPGVLSQYVAFPQDWFVRAPETLDDVSSSTLPCAGLTAWFALVERGDLQSGQTVALQGTGGVSLLALQIARSRGARVVITSGDDEKLSRAVALGADLGVNRHDEDWVEAVRTFTDDAGADHILELVGGAHLNRSLEAVAVQGRISLIGVLDGFDFSGSSGLLITKSPVIQGINVGHRRALEDFVAEIDRIQLKPAVDTVYPLAELPAALDHLDRGAFGKIVITLV